MQFRAANGKHNVTILFALKDKFYAFMNACP